MTNQEIADSRLHASCQWITIKNKKEWLELRKQGIGGSDVAGIFNQSPFTNKRGVWLTKQKDYISEQLTGFPIDFGNTFESIIFQVFKHKYINRYETLDYKEYLFRNYFISFYQASVDGILVDKKTKEVGILEIKTIQPSAICHWYDSDGNSITPLYYKYQILHYINVLELDFAVVYALANTENGDTSMRFLQPRRYDRIDLENELKEVNEKCIDFWLNFVETNVEPGITL